MPSIKQVIVAGKQTAMMPPADVVLHHIGEVQKRGNITVLGVAPIGDIELGLSDEGDGTAMMARAPIYFRSAHDGGSDDEIWRHVKVMYEDISRMFKLQLQDEVADNELASRNVIWPGDDFFQVTSDSDFVYLITKEESLGYNLNYMKNYLSVTDWPWRMRPDVIGLGGYNMEKDIITPPHTHIRFGGYEVELFVNVGNRHPRVEKKIAIFEWLLAYALYHMADDWGGDVSRLGPRDWVAAASMMLGSYGGWDGTVNLDWDFMGKDYIPTVLQTIALPFSRAMPYATFTHPVQNANQSDAVQALMMANILLAIGSAEVGGHTQAVEYHLKKGTLRLAHWNFPYFMKMPINYGGTQSIWLHPFTNRSLKDGVLFPMALRSDGFDAWVKQGMIEETLDTMQVDRGEVPLGDIKEARYKNFRFQVTRDGRVTEVWYDYEKYIVVRWPISREINRSTGMDLVLLYLTDGTASPRRAVFVDSNALETSVSLVGGGLANIVETFVPMRGGIIESNKRPIPGGIAAGKAPVEMVDEIQDATHVPQTAVETVINAEETDTRHLPQSIKDLDERPDSEKPPNRGLKAAATTIAEAIGNVVTGNAAGVSGDGK